MTKNRTLTLDEILTALQTKTLLGELQRRDYHQDDDIARAEALQQLLQWVADEVVGNDRLPPDDLAFGESEKGEFMRYGEHNLQDRQRQILRDNGYKTGEYDE